MGRPGEAAFRIRVTSTAFIRARAGRGLTLDVMPLAEPSGYLEEQ
jgi:hypothetical protein